MKIGPDHDYRIIRTPHGYDVPFFFWNIETTYGTFSPRTPASRIEPVLDGRGTILLFRTWQQAQDRIDELRRAGWKGDLRAVSWSQFYGLFDENT